MSGLSSTLSSLAKRSIPITSGFNDLVRGIGEAKSKDEEDGIVAKMVDLCRGALAGGRRDPRTSKELLLYLVYIDMLGHDTRWAHAWVIQLCSDKSLIVKKAAYLAASLLLPAESELHIMLTATIQADFRSDNWVVVATALTATNRIATAELAAVFVPAVIALTSHASQPVARRALLTLRRLLQLDPEAAPDVERVLVERLGHREPALMAAALCSLRELVARRPPQYAGLARYLVAILKQAYEGKLGRGFEVHRAPAPFVQVELLRLLRLLGAGNPGTAAEAAVVVAEAQRRAEGLGSALGAAVALEALRTRAALQPGAAAAAEVAEAATRMLRSDEANARYAGIDALSRLVDAAPERVAGAQLALLDALRGGDGTLARATLGLLFRVAGPANVTLIAGEVLAYLRSPAAAASGAAARRAVAAELLAVAERCAPDALWFARTAAETIAAAGEDAAPAGAGDALADVVAAFCLDDAGDADAGARQAVADAMLAWLDPPTLRAEGNDKGECEGAASNESPLANRPPTQLLIAAAWAAGACGHLSSRGVEGAVDALCALREAHAPDPRVLACAAGALGKLATRAGPGSAAARQAQDFLRHAARSAALDLQQRGVLALALLEEPAETRDAVWLADAGEEPDATAALDAIADRALAAGAAPYLSRAERAELGLGPQGLDGLYPLPGGAGGAGSAPLLYEAYARTEAPSAAPVVPVAAPVAETHVATIESGDKGLVGGQASAVSSPQQPTATAPQLLLNRGGQARKWGPQAASQAAPAAAPSPSPMSSEPRRETADHRPRPAQPEPVVDAAKQQLASSLFGGMPAGATSPAGVARRRVAEAPRSARSPASDLLGGLGDGPGSSSANGAPAPTAKPSALEDLLSLSFESSAPAAPSPAPAQSTAAPNLLELGFDSVLAGGAGPSATPSAPIVDPFAAPLAPNEPSPTNGPPGGMNFFGTNGGMAKAKSPEKKSPIADKKPVDPFADLLG